MFLSYEDTFAGLLSALAFCLRGSKPVYGLFAEGSRQTLLIQPEPVPTEEGILEKFDRYLNRHLGPDVMEHLFHASLSETEDMEMRLLGYLKTGLKMGRDPSGMLQNKDVAAVIAAERAVLRQSHAYLGLLRFKTMEGVYVADFEPDYRLLPVVTPHFADRMGDIPFLIRDVRRSLASVSLPGRPWFIIGLDSTDMAEIPQPDGGDRSLRTASPSMEEMWQSYFKVMAVPGRIRPSLQRSNMPKKYWKYLIEHPGPQVLQK